MTNALQVFAYDDNMIRTVKGADGETLFVAKDICEALELSNIGEAVSGLDEEELTSLKLMSGGQMREMKLVTEAGMYKLIFKSRKDGAKAFQKWVTSEVLPTIRKTGGYGVTAEAKELTERVAKMEKELAKAKKIAKKPKLDSVERYITQKIIQKPGYSFSSRFVLNDYLTFCTIHRLNPNPDKLHYRLINISKGLDAGWYVGIVIKGA